MAQNKQLKAEQKWLESTQNKLKKFISSPYWDSIELSDLHFSIVTSIMNTSNVQLLSPSINERVVDILLETIKNKLEKAKQNCRTR